MAEQLIYKIIFHNQGKVYEIYAKKIEQSNLYGFIEVSELVFGETSSLVIDPSEEKLKAEFKQVKRCFIPVHAIIRMDQVNQEGVGKITNLSEDSNIMPFPSSLFQPKPKGSDPK